MTSLKQLIFYWLSSSVIAIICYYLLWSIMPNNYVFGVFYRMFLYHYEYPILYILIPCFFYGIFATLFSKRFKDTSLYKQAIFMLIILALTILLSSPFGGMLWHYHDMKAGYFPEDWFWKMITKGTVMGLQYGWLIVALSAPYNVLGAIVSFYLMRYATKKLKYK